MNKINQIFNEFKQNKTVILEYVGSIDNSLLEQILFEIEAKSEQYGKAIKRKLFLVSVELIQNLYAYTIKRVQDEINTDYCFILLMINEDMNFEVITANFVNEQQLKKLVTKINIVNGKNTEELNEYYREVLNNNKRTEKGGAGLGIIDLKRKSDEKINFSYINFTKNLYFFIFKIILKNK